MQQVLIVGRWLVLVPLSLTVAYLAGALVSGLAGLGDIRGLLYVGALVSGLSYVWAGLTTARCVAPSHRRLVLVILGLAFVGDLAFVNLAMPEDMLTSASTSGIGILLTLLRAGEYADLQAGVVFKLVGAAVGLASVWIPHVLRAGPQRALSS